MNFETFCKKLRDLKSRNLSGLSYLGARWFVLKIALAAVGVYLLVCPATMVKVFGGVVIGYTAGATIAGIRSWIVNKRAWPFQKQAIDWNAVEQSANAEERH